MEEYDRGTEGRRDSGSAPIERVPPSRRPAVPPSSDWPGVSVVVIGRNEGERLTRCIESVMASEYPADLLEVIYVDTDSTDGSCVRAEGLGAKVISIRPGRPCAAAGRNAGFRQARFELVHFLDGDTILDPGWLSKAVAAMHGPSSPRQKGTGTSRDTDSAAGRSPRLGASPLLPRTAEVACVFGRREEMHPTATVYNFWMHHDWYVAAGPANSCAGDALFRRDVLLRMDGYDETLIAGEEPDLCYRIRDRLGMTILCLDEPMTRHDIDMRRFRSYWRRCVRTGHAYAEVGGRYPGYTAWRRKRRQNVIHVLAVLLAGVLSLVLWSVWPIAAWAGLVLGAVARNAWRCRRRVGGLAGAFVYSLHHYLSKVPMTVGQCDYWLRQATRRRPRTLIEYRTS